MNYDVNDRFRVATEIEWEHGPAFSSGFGTGKIYLAKAFAEYKLSDALLVRAGKFVSPFGIYNERHDATPTFLSTFLAKSVYGDHVLGPGITGRLYAKHFTGIQILGELLSENWGLKYQVYLSNGRGPLANEKDNNNNKGLGYRFVVTTPLQGLKLGTSLYTDKNGNVFNARQSTYGFDIEYDISNFHLESEFLLPRFENLNFSNLPNNTFRKMSAFYVLGAYTIFNNLTPFARYDFFRPNITDKSIQEEITTLGINYAVSMSVYLKAEVHFHHNHELDILNSRMFVCSLAIAF